MQSPISGQIDKIVAGENGAAFDILGAHRLEAGAQSGTIVRAFLPEAKAAAVRHGKDLHPMRRTHEGGFYEAVLPGVEPPIWYRLVVTLADGTEQERIDPYSLSPVLSDFDLHLFMEGTNYQIHSKLGAHVGTHGEATGTSFAVWAPNAARVSVIGSFNRWDERRHPMRRRGASGIWEIFLPGVGEGELYKYHIKTQVTGANSVKADPIGFAMELRPNTASVVYDLRRYQWGDAEWMANRAARSAPDAPISIYEVHLGSWRRGDVPAGDAVDDASRAGRWLTYRELAETLIPYAKDLGYTHLELLPVMEHPFDGSWGYQTVGYFAPTSRHGSPDDFRWFIDRAHQAGLGVILDWVPAHFPRDGHGLVFFDGTHLYEHADPRKGHHKDWDTFIFDYGRHEVRAYLISNALFWLDEYHADGLRVDAVASMLYLDYSRQPGEWVPNERGGRENLDAVTFLKRLNELVHMHFPEVLISAEESTAWPGVTQPVAKGGLGFDLKWNMGWMNDTLAYAREDPLARQHHQRRLTFSLMYAFSERFLLPLSHDEVVHGKRALLQKMPGDAWKKLATLRLLYGYMATHPGKKLLFMGGEIGQWREWHHDRQLDWELLEDPAHAALQAYVRDLNGLVVSQPALYQLDFDHQGFDWIDFKDEARSVISFLRRGRDPNDFVVVVANWTPVPRENYRIGIPAAGNYRQVLNSDAARFGGSDCGVMPLVESSPEPAQRRPYSLVLTLPPLGIVVFAPVRAPEARDGKARVATAKAKKSTVGVKKPAAATKRATPLKSAPSRTPRRPKSSKTSPA